MGKGEEWVGELATSFAFLPLTLYVPVWRLVLVLLCPGKVQGLHAGLDALVLFLFLLFLLLLRLVQTTAGSRGPPPLLRSSLRGLGNNPRLGCPPIPLRLPGCLPGPPPGGRGGGGLRIALQWFFTTAAAAAPTFNYPSSRPIASSTLHANKLGPGCQRLPCRERWVGGWVEEEGVRWVGGWDVCVWASE